MVGLNPPTLVIGYGNDLRRDDGAGRRVADILAAAAVPGVEVRAQHQLTPELAGDLHGRRIVFVDAAVDTDRVRHRPVAAPESADVMTHHVDPAGLLALAALIGTPAGPAHLVTVPAHDLRVGTELSQATADAVAEAAQLVLALCAGRPPAASR